MPEICIFGYFSQVVPWNVIPLCTEWRRCMSNWGGLSISEPKPGFTPGWIHLLIHEFNVNRRLTHEWHVIDHGHVGSRRPILYRNLSPSFTPGWIHLLIHEFGVDQRLTHKWHIIDHACANTTICVYTIRLHDLVWKQLSASWHSTGYVLNPVADTGYIQMASHANTLHHDFARHHELVNVEEELVLVASRWIACVLMSPLAASRTYGQLL
jgi:hypothetical protein